jgi:phosphoglycerate dehydrogenase-like enzyme
MRMCIVHEQGRAFLEQLPAGVQIEVAEEPSRDVEFWVPPFLRPPADAAAVAALPALRVVQLLTAGADAWIGRLPAEVTLCHARGVHSSATAEWAMTAILSHIRDFPYFIREQARGTWSFRPTGELAEQRVLLVGSGDIGAALAARLQPFEVELVRVARQARPGVHAAAELPALLPAADVVVLLVPLTAATAGMVDTGFLAAMRDGALLVNASRGRVVQTPALTVEVITGRIGAALDVTDPEPLPPGHPLWGLPNVLLTPHVAASVGGMLRRAYGFIGDQVRRYLSGQSLVNVVTGDY